MKAVIPVAGAGKKLRPHTHTQPKPLVPIAGKPILGHIVDFLLHRCDVHEFIFVIGYLGSKIESYIRRTYGGRNDLNIEFVVQEPRKGSAHAVWTARKYIEKEQEVLIMLGDTIVDVDFRQVCALPFNTICVKKVDNPRCFGIAEVNREGFAKKLVEKPRIPKSNLALVGLYKIVNIPLLLKAVSGLIDDDQRNNGEYHLTDALMRMIESGERIGTVPVNQWFDCGKKETLLEANEILLSMMGFQTSEAEDYPKNNILIQPVRFGKNCDISNSIIGPNVAIGDNTSIQSSIVRNTIIGSDSMLENAVLDNSIIGNDSTLKGFRQSLNIGDSTEINFTN